MEDSPAATIHVGVVEAAEPADALNGTDKALVESLAISYFHTTRDPANTQNCEEITPTL